MSWKEYQERAHKVILKSKITIKNGMLYHGIMLCHSEIIYFMASCFTRKHQSLLIAWASLHSLQIEFQGILKPWIKKAASLFNYKSNYADY